jgi:hypothetical protein
MNILEAARLGQGMGGSSAPMGITGSNMALRNLQVPQIGNTINAQPAKLQEIDKIKYQEQMKENLRQQQFNALNSAMAEDRVFADNMALNEQTHAQRLSEEGLRYENVLSAQKAASAQTLETERKKLKIDEDRLRMETRLADEKYGKLRGSVNNIFNDYENWITVGKKQYIENRENQLLAELAIRQGVTPEQVQAMYQATGAQFGYTPGATITRATNPQLYDKLAVQVLLRGQQDNQDVSRVRAAVIAETEQISQRKAVLYKVASDQVTKLGFSVGGASENIPLTSGENTNRPKITGESLNGVNLADLVNGKTGGNDKTGGGGGGKVPLTPEYNYIMAPLAKKGIDTAEGVYNWLKENPASAGKSAVLAAATALTLDQFRRLSPEKMTQIQKAVSDEIDLTARTTDTPKTRNKKIPPKKPFAKGEESEVKDKLKKAKKAGNSRAVRQLEKRLNDGYPTYRDVDTGTNKELTGAAKNVKAKSVAPDIMMKHAKKLDPSGLGKKDLDFWKSADPDKFGEMIRKSQGGLINKLTKWGVKVLPKDKNALSRLAGSKYTKMGGYALGAGALLDLITYSQALNDEQRAEARKEVEAIKEANDAYRGGLEARIAELEAELEPSSSLRP